MNKVIKGIKLRLYPNQSQREQLWQMFGNDRFVWNQMLGMAKERYQNNPNSLFVNEYGELSSETAQVRVCFSQGK